MFSIPIIGRDSELTQINSRLRERSTRSIVFVSGKGGVGKTRLLQEIQEHFLDSIPEEEKNIYQLLPLVHFDDHALHISENVRQFLFHKLGAVNFGTYVRSVVDRNRMKQAGISRERLVEEEKLVNTAFLNDFNALAVKHKIVLFFDTVDNELRTTETWQYLIDLLSNLQNAAVLVAGRVANELFTEIASKVGRDVEQIELHPLSSDASNEYLELKQKELHIAIAPEIATKLITLAQGRPILIDLAVEWMARAIPLPWLENSTVQEVAKFQSEFEQQLVAPIGELRSTMDRVTLLLSYIYPLNERGVTHVLRIDPEGIHEVFQEADRHICLKKVANKSLTLHDEVRRMVDPEVWHRIDPSGERRIEYSKRFVEFAEKEVDQLRDRTKHKPLPPIIQSGKPFSDDIDESLSQESDREELWFLEILRLDHTLRIDIRKGVDLFQDLYEKATAAYEFSVRNVLLTTLEARRNILSASAVFTLELFRAESNTEEGNVEFAYQSLMRYADKRDLDISLWIRMLIVLGNCSVRLGRMEEADEFFKKALELSSDQPRKMMLGKVESELGWLRRLQGRWDQADKLYSSALKYCFQEEDLATAAVLLNSIGYIHHLQGDFSGGRTTCLQALEICERLGRPREKGMAYSTLGEVYSASEQYEEAMKQYSQALEIFEARRDWEWVCTVKHEIAHSLWVQNRFEEAWKYIQESYAIAENHKIGKELPTILYHMGWIYWDHNRFETLGEVEYKNSTDYFHRSYDASIRWQDKHRQLGNLVAFAYIDYIFGKTERIPIYVQELETEIRSNKLDYPLLKGQMERIQGNVDYDVGRNAKSPEQARKCYDKALKHYKLGLPLIAKHGGSGRDSLVNELLFLGDRIDDLEPQLAIGWCESLREAWSKKKDITTRYSQLLNFCNVHLAFAKSRL